MNILYIVYHGFSKISGISNKIKYQINGLKQNGNNVDVCTYTILKNKHRVRQVNGNTIHDFGKGYFASLQKKCNYNDIYDYIKSNKIDFIYVRSFHNANPFTINLYKRVKRLGINMVMEIPTYPYDQEYLNFALKYKFELLIDKIYRNKLASYFNAIVTFTDDKSIFNKRTICISNGIDFSEIPIQKKINGTTDTINLIGVAEVHYWHGFDRLIAGLGEYYSKPHKYKVYFHIVGGIAPSEMFGSNIAPGFKQIIDKYHIAEYVIFHGPLYGDNLNNIFNITDFAIGSLARHRSGIMSIKTLKNREYAARGIPFIYSENDNDFDNKPYILKASADESPINIDNIINFININEFSPNLIRNSIMNLSWNEQMGIVLKEIYHEKI